MHEICIDVDEVERAVAFYGGAIGLKVVKQDKTWAQLADGDTTFWIMQLPEGGTASPELSIPRDYRRHWTPVHLDFIVADADATAKRAIAAGGKLEGKVQERPNGGKFANFVDPFGNGVDIVQRPKKG